MRRNVLLAGLLLVLATGAFFSPKIWRSLTDYQPANVPNETNVPVINTNTSTANVNSINTNTANTNVPVVLPAEVNLSAPFTSQAPHANWDAEHEEFCEEASILMVARALQGRTITNADDAERGLQELKTWQEEEFGYFESTTAVETMKIITDFYKLPARLLTNPTVDDLKAELAAKRFIVVPAAGQELGNPYYTPPGPVYHMLTLKGYTAKGTFITNDPGTRNGKNYVYTFEVLMNAIHDWNGGDVLNGRRVVIVVG